jgi:hypothetical protein
MPRLKTLVQSVWMLISVLRCAHRKARCRELCAPRLITDTFQPATPCRTLQQMISNTKM